MKSSYWRMVESLENAAHSIGPVRWPRLSFAGARVLVSGLCPPVHFAVPAGQAANCIAASRAYRPPRATSSACGPASTTRPCSSTKMQSTRCTVARRCAMTMVVRPRIAVSQRGLHRALALGVEGRRRFVEQQQRRVLQDGARDRQSLTLPAGQPQPAFADLGRVAVRQAQRRTPRRAPPAPRPALRRRWRRGGRSGCCRAPSRRRSPLPAAPPRSVAAASSNATSRTSTPSTRTAPSPVS